MRASFWKDTTRKWSETTMFFIIKYTQINIFNKYVLWEMLIRKINLEYEKTNYPISLQKKKEKEKKNYETNHVIRQNNHLQTTAEQRKMRCEFT
jgi:hypothetical protein